MTESGYYKAGYNKKNIAAVATLALVLIIGVAAYANSIQNQTVSTGTVTQTNYPTTTTVTTVTGASGVTTETNTITEQPVQTLTTTTVSGTQTYTATSTQTVGGSTSTSTVTTTSTLNSLLYQPFAMYYTATTNNPFYSQVTPITATATDGTTFSETVNGGGSVTMTIDATSATYYDLGFYYDFYASSAPLTLSWFSTHSLTISGTGFANNLWLNLQGWTWTPNGIGASQYVSQGTNGAYGLGTTTGTTTISSASSYFITAQGSSVPSGCSGHTYTIAELMTAPCNFSPSTPFAIWVGIGSTAIGTTPATVTQITSTYP